MTFKDLSKEDQASIRRGIADVKAGRVTPWREALEAPAPQPDAAVQAARAEAVDAGRKLAASDHLQEGKAYVRQLIEEHGEALDALIAAATASASAAAERERGYAHALRLAEERLLEFPDIHDLERGLAVRQTLAEVRAALGGQS